MKVSWKSMLPTQSMPLYHGVSPSTVQQTVMTRSHRKRSHLLVAVGNISDLVPREGALGREPVVWLVDVQTQGVHSQKKIRSLFILNHMSRANNQT